MFFTHNKLVKKKVLKPTYSFYELKFEHVPGIALQEPVDDKAAEDSGEVSNGL